MRIFKITVYKTGKEQQPRKFQFTTEWDALTAASIMAGQNYTEVTLNKQTNTWHVQDKSGFNGFYVQEVKS